VVRYTEARERTLRALDRISSAALVNQDIESLLPRTLDAFLETTASVDSVALALFEGEALRVRAAVGFPGDGPVGAELPRDGTAARVAADGLPTLVRDGGTPCGEMCPPGTRALYAVPLELGDSILGVATMGSRSNHEFSQEEQFLFRTMVHRATALIHQAGLRADLAQHAIELRAEGDTCGAFDPDRTAQVVSNLVANAIHHSPESSAVRIGVRGEKDELVLEVHNEGAPIPAEVMPRLFEAFQPGVKESGPNAGLGLGLYIVQQIVDGQGGSIEVRSEEGDGTTFTVRLPRRAAPA
jgi:K+-sensing histidine kinase KdpD